MNKSLCFWYASLPISTELREKLLQCDKVTEIYSLEDINENSLIIYFTPDEIIDNYLKNSNNNSTLDSIFDVYNKLLNQRFENKICLIPHWQLEQLNSKEIGLFLENPSNENSFNKKRKIKRRSPNKLSIYITHQLSRKYPEWIDQYLDIELNAFLINKEIDVKYKEFLIENALKEEAFVDSLKIFFHNAKEKDSLTRENENLLNTLEGKNIELEKIRNNQDNLTKENENFLNALEDKNIELEKIRNNQDSLIEEKDNLLCELDVKNIELEKIRNNQDNLTRENENFLNALEDKNIELEKIRNNQDNLINKLDKQVKELNALKNEELFYLEELNILQSEVEKYFNLITFYKSILKLQQFELERSCKIIKELFDKNEINNSLLSNKELKLIKNFKKDPL